MRVDVGDFGSVRAFARGVVKQLQAQQQKVKLLVNNAGPDLQLVYQEMACSSLQSCVPIASLYTFQSARTRLIIFCKLTAPGCHHQLTGFHLPFAKSQLLPIND